MTSDLKDPYTILPSYSYVDEGIATYAVILPLYAALIAGSGGAYGPVNIQAASQFTNAPVVRIIETRGDKETHSAFVSQLFRIRDVFALTMSDLAGIFDVTRQTAYAWLRGTEPRPEVIEKIWMLSSWASDFETLCVQGMGSYLRRPLVDGKTLLVLLTEGTKLDVAVEEIRRLAASDEASARLIYSKRSKNHHLSSLLDLSPVISNLE